MMKEICTEVGPRKWYFVVLDRGNFHGHARTLVPILHVSDPMANVQ